MTQIPMFFFYLIAFGVLGICAIVAFSNNLLHSAFALFFALFGMGGFYVLLGADFLAVVQVMVYAGGVCVLLIFGTMLTADLNKPETSNRSFNGVLAFLSGVAILTLILTVFDHAAWPTLKPGVMEPTTKSLGFLLLKEYILPFEVISFLLLAAMIGALVLVIKGDRK